MEHAPTMGIEAVRERAAGIGEVPHEPWPSAREFGEGARDGRRAPLETPLPSTPDPSRQTGRVLRGTYRILRRLDAGGMAVVFEAVHLRLGRLVAVKLLMPHLASDSTSLLRFRREAQNLSRLNHPNIVRVIDFDTAETGEPFLVLELLRGQTLQARLARERLLQLSTVVGIVEQVGSALDAAHRALIVHRDLKPANIFLETPAGEDTFVRLLDFGISSARPDPRLTAQGTVLGTPGYMAPEQARGTDSIDHRVDQYALGAIAYEMLAGRPVFSGSEAVSVLMAALNQTPSPLAEVAPWAAGVSDVVMRALKKSPEERYSTVAKFVEAFRTAADETGRENARQKLDRPVSGRRVSSAAADAARESNRAPRCDGTHASEARELVSLARSALASGRIQEAAFHAERAFDLGIMTQDLKAHAIVEAAKPLFSHIFMMRLGGSNRRLTPSTRCDGVGLTLSSSEAFLLSRLEGGLTLEQILDVAALPRLQALRSLAGLVRRGMCG
jgi:serine/threonine protein kinase